MSSTLGFAPGEGREVSFPLASCFRVEVLELEPSPCLSNFPFSDSDLSAWRVWEGELAVCGLAVCFPGLLVAWTS